MSVRPNLPHLEIFQDMKKPLQVIGMRMGQNDRFKLFDSFPPQVGGKNIFPYIKSPAAGIAATVYKHIFASRQANKRGAALTDINGRDLQIGPEFIPPGEIKVINGKKYHQGAEGILKKI